MNSCPIRRALAVTVLAMSAGGLAHAQIAISANDAKVTLVDGVQTVAKTPPPDTITIIDLSASPPKVIGELRVPTSVVGPPQSVAIAPDRSIAIVTAAMKIDPADPTKTVPDDKITVIDLGASPPAIIATLQAGSAPSGVSINRAGTLALVANRSEGTVSVFTISGKTVTPAGKVDLAARDSGPSHVAISPDGRTALVSRNNDSLISVLSIDGTKVAYTKQDIAGGFKPYGVEVTPAGDIALVANIGAGATGGTDTVAVVDMTAKPPRVVDQIAVGPVPEGLAISPDGRFVSLTVMNGSNAPKSSPLFNDFGLLRIFAIRNRTIVPVTETRIGHWCQGTAWSGAANILVQCMVEQQILRFRFDGQRLTADAPIKVNGGPAGIRVAQR